MNKLGKFEWSAIIFAMSVFIYGVVQWLGGDNSLFKPASLVLMLLLIQFGLCILAVRATDKHNRKVTEQMMKNRRKI